MPLQVHERLCLQPVFVVSNLATPAILGIDFIHAHGLLYDGLSRTVQFPVQFSTTNSPAGDTRSEGGVLALSKATTITALSAAMVSARGFTAKRATLGNSPLALATAHCADPSPDHRRSRPGPTQPPKANVHATLQHAYTLCFITPQARNCKYRKHDVSLSKPHSACRPQGRPGGRQFGTTRHGAPRLLHLPMMLLSFGTT